MEFPSFAPSSRQYSDGDWPITTSTSVDGYEVRILHGNLQTGMEMTVQYSKLSDSDARLFLNHYRQQKGSFIPFQFPELNYGPQRGWGGENKDLGVSSRQNKWRYSKPPTVTSVYPGISDVSVSLLAVLI